MRLAACLLSAWSCLLPCAALAQSAVRHWDPDARLAPVPAAFGGYCVVALRNQHQWQPGEERFSAFFDGRRYQFATARERDIFAAAPQAYAPMLGGDCPVTFAETGRRVPGQLEFGLLHGSRLVFFASDDQRQFFLGDPAQFQNADLALGGRCIVSRRMRGKDVAGIPEASAIYRGLRYWFASARDRELFLENPGRYDGSGAGGPDATSNSQVAAQSIEDDVASVADDNPWGLPNQSQEGGSESRSGSEDDVILGALPVMTGYCPVRLKNDGVWVRGRYEHRIELGGQVFLTAGPVERDALRNNPAKYVPALGGDCAVSFIDSGERLRGSVYHAFEYEGRLFLFADAQQKAAFEATPEKYASADWATDGMCVVTLAEKAQQIPGLAEHAAWFNGKLYRFAGAEQKDKFLSQPEKYAIK